MRVYTWINLTDALVVIANSPAEAEEVAKKEGISIDRSPDTAIELTEPTPAVVLYTGQRKEVNMEPTNQPADPEVPADQGTQDQPAQGESQEQGSETPATPEGGSEGEEQTGGETPSGEEPQQ